MTAIERARSLARILQMHGIPTPNEIIAVLCDTISQAEAEARQDERKRLTAEMLAEALPGDVLQMAAERVIGRGF